MKQAVLVLQYPDPRMGRTVAIASTKDRKALKVFRQVVLKEAHAAYRGLDDEVLATQEVLEAERLQRLLDLVIPKDARG